LQIQRTRYSRAFFFASVTTPGNRIACAVMIMTRGYVTYRGQKEKTGNKKGGLKGKNKQIAKKIYNQIQEESNEKVRNKMCH